MHRNAASDGRESGRTAQDACATLVELARALKGWQFYAPSSPARGDLLDRTFRVLCSEIGRGGPLALEVRRGAFWLAGTDVAVGTGRLDELARRLYERAVGRVVFEAELEPAAIAAFLDVLVDAPETVAAAGGFEARFFREPHRGIRLNDTDWRSLLARATAAAAASSLDTTLPAFLDPEQTDGLVLAEEAEVVDETDPLDLLDDLAPPPAATPSEPAPEARTNDLFAEHLGNLDDCDDDRRYRESARDVVFEATSRIEAGRRDDGYRALCAFAKHAGDDAKRSLAQRDSAKEALLQLARGPALDDLVERSCDADADASVAAVGVLREIGAGAVPRLLDAIDAAAASTSDAPGESNRRARLSGIVVAMGDEAAPLLGEAITSGVARRQRAAVRLAGETQNPRLVPSLRDALLGASDEVSREAAQSLARIGDVSSLEALAEGLESPRPSIAGFAAAALGATGRALAVGPLAAALDRALGANKLGVARDLARALGRSARAEAVPVLADLIARGGFLQRARLRDLKLAAVAALTQIPGHSADEALARAAKAADGAVRQAAAVARKRRARGPSAAA